MTLISSRGTHLLPPSVDEIRDGVRRLFPTDFDAVWGRACSAAALSPGAIALDPDQTTRLIDAVGGLDPLGRIMSLSWRIRMTAAMKLSEIGR